MAHRRRKPTAPAGDVAALPDDGDPDSATPVPVALDDDLAWAARSAASEHRRFLVRDGDNAVAAIIPVEDLRLLLRLEEAELDRIDREEARRALADPDNGPPIPWQPVGPEATP